MTSPEYVTYEVAEKKNSLLIACSGGTMRFDVVIVGGSFAGLSAAMQLARTRRTVAVIDAGKPRNRFARASHGFFGQDGRAPADIMAIGREQLRAYPSVTFIDDEATSAQQSQRGFTIRTRQGQELAGARLVLATGLRDELPDIPGLEERWGVSVFVCPYCDGYENRDQRIGVVSAGAMSFHQALLISEWGPTTYFTQNLHEPDAEQVRQLEARDIHIEKSPVIKLHGTGTRLEQVRHADGRTSDVSALFVLPRARLASDLAEQLGCEIENRPTGPIIRVDDFKLTSVSGVYAAGDVSNAMMPNATLASASGVIAGISAHQSLVFAS